MRGPEVLMSEELIIRNCSPTLAGIKAGSLFSVRLTEEIDIYKEVRELNMILSSKGLRVIPIERTEQYALIYLYRPKHLKSDLNDPKALRILKSRGYNCDNIDYCIVQLVKHLKNDDIFPHEIGLFLGYPPSDVECFINHPCKGVKCCGYWKVYSEPKRAQETFKRFSECTKVYQEMNKKGKSLAQLAVITA